MFSAGDNLFAFLGGIVEALFMSAANQNAARGFAANRLTFPPASPILASLRLHLKTARLAEVSGLKSGEFPCHGPAGAPAGHGVDSFAGGLGERPA